MKRKDCFALLADVAAVILRMSRRFSGRANRRTALVFCVEVKGVWVKERNILNFIKKVARMVSCLLPSKATTFTAATRNVLQKVKIFR
jgi:hypothetical protein